jgi:DMSO/TMAO reductase YedYZ molybdopterin-dependent catalytic subunit
MGLDKMENSQSGREINKDKTKQITRREFINNASSLIVGSTITSFLLLSACQNHIAETKTTETTKNTKNTQTSQTSMSPDKIIYSPDTQRANRLPPNQYETKGWPILQAGIVPQINTSEWKFTLSGLVDNNITLNYSEFMNLPMVKVFSDVHCVTGWSRLDNLWEGVSSQAIVDLVGIKPEAKYVIVKANFDYYDYTTNLALIDFLEEDVLFPIKHNDQPLSPQHGGPVRLVVPRLYFWKSAKWVSGLEFTDADYPGYWESAGYNNHGDPWKEERY